MESALEPRARPRGSLLRVREARRGRHVGAWSPGAAARWPCLGAEATSRAAYSGMVALSSATASESAATAPAYSIMATGCETATAAVLTDEAEEERDSSCISPSASRRGLRVLSGERA